MGPWTFLTDIEFDHGINYWVGVFDVTFISKAKKPPILLVIFFIGLFIPVFILYFQMIIPNVFINMSLFFTKDILIFTIMNSNVVNSISPSCYYTNNKDILTNSLCLTLYLYLVYMIWNTSLTTLDNLRMLFCYCHMSIQISLLVAHNLYSVLTIYHYYHIYFSSYYTIVYICITYRYYIILLIINPSSSSTMTSFINFSYRAGMFSILLTDNYEYG